MPLETELVTLVATVVPNTWAKVAPNDAELPYLVYNQIGGQAPTFMGREVPSKRNADMQIDIYCETDLEAIAKMLAVESVLTLATTLQAKPVGAMRGTLDDESDLRGASQDFTIWADR